jgi:hypothetical protein
VEGVGCCAGRLKLVAMKTKAANTRRTDLGCMPFGRWSFMMTPGTKVYQKSAALLVNSQSEVKLTFSLFRSLTSRVVAITCAARPPRYIERLCSARLSFASAKGRLSAQSSYRWALSPPACSWLDSPISKTCMAHTGRSSPCSWPRGAWPKLRAACSADGASTTPAFFSFSTLTS